MLHLPSTVAGRARIHGDKGVSQPSAVAAATKQRTFRRGSIPTASGRPPDSRLRPTPNPLTVSSSLSRVRALLQIFTVFPQLMNRLWNDVVVAVKRKRRGDKHTMSKRARLNPDRSADSGHARTMVEAQDTIIKDRFGSGSLKLTSTVLDVPQQGRAAGLSPKAFKDKNDYERQREEITRRERALGFDHACYLRASDKEILADKILQRLKVRDKEYVYEAAGTRTGYAGQKHKRRPGDHLLSNIDLIEQSEVFRVARQMPKGGHLHIHFNACLQPHVLLDVAKGMDHMYIMSDIPLTDDYLSYERCEIQFSIKSLAEAQKNPGNPFSVTYEKGQTMPLGKFLDEFPKHHPKGVSGYDWLLSKLVFSEDEAHDKLQTSYGAWEKFNSRTRMMKGLFNYERAYRVYTRALLEDFLRDNIQYAEIRPNFMPNNQLWKDDGCGKIDNWGIMDIIIDEYNKFQQEKKGYFAGLKVIYCTPRSFEQGQVEFALNECFEFKRKWPDWIAGLFSTTHHRLCGQS